jgi:phosphoserine aminotransferase
MLAVEDYLDALGWAEGLGGLGALMARADANADALGRWVEATPWVANLAWDPATRSNTSVCLSVVDADVASLPEEARARFAKALAGLLEKEGAGFDIASYRDAPPGLRIWCGSTVETADVEALTAWLDWAFAVVKSDLARAA